MLFRKSNAEIKIESILNEKYTRINKFRIKILKRSRFKCNNNEKNEKMKEQFGVKLRVHFVGEDDNLRG